jgi:hypothetical protein
MDINPYESPTDCREIAVRRQRSGRWLTGLVACALSLVLLAVMSGIASLPWASLRNAKLPVELLATLLLCHVLSVAMSLSDAKRQYKDWQLARLCLFLAILPGLAVPLYWLLTPVRAPSHRESQAVI